MPKIQDFLVEPFVEPSKPITVWIDSSSTTFQMLFGQVVFGQVTFGSGLLWDDVSDPTTNWNEIVNPLESI